MSTVEARIKTGHLEMEYSDSLKKVVDVWKTGPDSAGGVSVSIDFLNTTEKEMKYITFRCVPYNSVNDIVASTIGDTVEVPCQLTGPIKAKKSGTVRFENIWYNRTITKAAIKEINIQYMDGSEETIEENDIVTYGSKGSASGAKKKKKTLITLGIIFVIIVILMVKCNASGTKKKSSTSVSKPTINQSVNDNANNINNLSEKTQSINENSSLITSSDNTSIQNNKPQYTAIADYAGIIDVDKAKLIQEDIQYLERLTGSNIRVLTTTSKNGMTEKQYADSYFDSCIQNGSMTSNGLVLLVDMESNKVYFSTAGNMISILSNDRISQLGNDFVDTYNSKKDFYDAFSAVFKDIESYYVNSSNQTVTSDANDEYILPGSDISFIDETVLNGLDEWKCKLARNEIYARHGRLFSSEELQQYFNSKSWYNGTIQPSSFDDSVLNEFEKENVKTIQNYEKTHGFNQ